jgi:hypothetical protein
MNPLDPHSDLYAQVLADFKRWSANQIPHRPGMFGQTETHFPCKAAYAVAGFDHGEERYTAIRVMVITGSSFDWHVATLARGSTCP